jgi:hypothetical protein
VNIVGCDCSEVSNSLLRQDSQQNRKGFLGFFKALNGQ